MFALALATLLTFGFVSCQNKGSDPSCEDWQAMYEALSDEEQAKFGEGIKSVTTSGLSKETIVGSAFDSTYAIDAGGEKILFSIIMLIDTTGTVDGIEKLGLSPELDDENWNTYWVQATFEQLIAAARIEDVLHVEAETEWYAIWKDLDQEERQRVGTVVIPVASYLYEKLYTANEPSTPSLPWAALSGAEAMCKITILTSGSTEGIRELGLELRKPFDPDRINWFTSWYYSTGTLQQIVALGRLPNVNVILRGFWFEHSWEMPKEI